MIEDSHAFRNGRVGVSFYIVEECYTVRYFFLLPI